jgi:hypothetical protein
MAVWTYLRSSLANNGNFFWKDTGLNQKLTQTRNGPIRDMYSYRTNVLDAVYQPNQPMTNWYLITMTFKTNQWKAYTNGILGATDTTVTTGPTGTLLEVGISPNTGGTMMDRAVIYNRILSSQEVWNMYINTHPTNRIWRK